MTLLDDLKEHVASTFRARWETRDGRIVPSPSDLKLTNDAVFLDQATVLYADLTGSTKMVDSIGWECSAEVYKNFLFCSAKIIKADGGVITSYDGDRVMAIFIGAGQCTSACKCALRINWVVQEVINPALKKQYSASNLTVSQVVGIDTSAIRAARTGVRGDNDIVWVGRAANYAAKLTEIKRPERTWITDAVYSRISDEAKLGGSAKDNMWERFDWTEHDGMKIFGSKWRWAVS